MPKQQGAQQQQNEGGKYDLFELLLFLRKKKWSIKIAGNSMCSESFLDSRYRQFFLTFI